MAKKIRLDFSKTEERSGWNTRAIPEGLHKAKIVSVQETEAGDGIAMLVYALAPADPRYKSRLFPFYCKLQQNQYWKLRDLAVAAGMTIPKKAVNFDPDAPVGKTIAIEVEDETGQYAGRSQVQATYGLDILDEDGAAADDDDEEEYEGDEEEADEEEYEDEEDEEDDEEEEDLSSLTLAELRKRAKGLGIDHAGVKKNDLIDMILEEEEAEDEDEDELDDDDLEDEDLEDEDFEDDEDDEEEEEPEPAPRRRAASAKAKAPAKAATAKRTVKRR